MHKTPHIIPSDVRVASITSPSSNAFRIASNSSAEISAIGIVICPDGSAEVNAQPYWPEITED